MSRYTTYQIPETRRSIIDAGPGWYVHSFKFWRRVPPGVIPPEQQNDPAATPPMRGARWFTQRQLDLMGVKVQ